MKELLLYDYYVVTLIVGVILGGLLGWLLAWWCRPR